MSRTPDEAYAELIRRVKASSLLSSCGSLLHWDHQTYMPPKGAAHRADQLALLAGLAHDQFVAPEVGDLLSQAEQGGGTRESGAATALLAVQNAMQVLRGERCPHVVNTDVLPLLERAAPGAAT